MNKKILILNGSPRKSGNTAALCDAFTQGATASGHTAQRFDIAQMNVRPCLGCLKGGKDPSSPCTQKGDMDKIYPAYKDADIVVLASPMYYWNFTAQLKAAFDRLFAVTESDPNYQTPIKDCMLLMAAEGDDAGNWKPLLDYYHALLGQLGWKDLGQALAGGVMQVGDIAGHKGLDDARKLGASIS